MKKLRYIILFTIFSIFATLVIVIKLNLTKITNYVLKEIVKINVKVDKVNINGLNLEINGIEVNELRGENIGHVKRATLKINPFLITRLGNIDLYGGDFLIYENKNGFLNLENIIKESKGNNDVRNSSISKVNIHNIDVIYRTDKFKVRINQKVKDVSGHINLLKKINYEINVSGKTLDQNDKKTGKLSVLLNENLLNLKFSDFYTRKEFLQYVPIDFIEVEKANLNGYIKIFLKEHKDNVKLNLNGIVYGLEYDDYDNKIEKAKIDLNLDDKGLDLNANTKLNNNDFNLNVNTNLKEKLGVGINFKNIAYKDLEKYKLLNKLNLGLDGNVDGKINLGLNIKDIEKIKLEKYIIDLKSKNIKYKNIEFNDFYANLDSEKDKNIDIKGNIKNDQFKNIDANLDIKGKLDIEKLNGKLDINLENKENIESIKKLKIDLDLYGKDNIKAKIYNNDLESDLDYVYKDGKYNLNIKAKKENQGINIIGSTTEKDLIHNYNINYNDNIYNIHAKLTGIKEKVDLDFNGGIKNYKKSNVYLYNLNLIGKAKNVFSEDRLVSAKGNLSEVWLKYQRLVDLNFDLNLENNLLKVYNIKNKNLRSNFEYDLKDKKINADLILSNYMLYTTDKNIDANLFLDNLNLKIRGDINNPNITGNIEPSRLIINKQNMGKLTGRISTENDIIKLNSNIKENNIYGEYNRLNKNLYIKLNVDQNIDNVMNVKGLKARIKSNSELFGNIDNINGDLKFNIEDIIYNERKFPKLQVSAKAKNLNLLKDDKTGIIDVDDISLISKNEEKIYNTKMLLDLENIDINIDLENKVVDLSKISPELKGNLELNGYLRGKKKDYFGELTLISNDFSISNNKFKNLILSVQLDNKGFNIGQGYLEYENNPLLVNGYMLFNPLTYNLRVLANNFNLAFLKLNKSIKNAEGIANVDLLLQDGNLEGNVKLEDFLLKTDDINISKANINLEMLNRDIKINKFVSNFNGGKIILDGNLKFPNINKETIKRKKFDLEDSLLNLKVKNIEFKKKTNKLKINSDLKLESKKILGNIDLIGGEINNLAFLENKSKKGKNKYSVPIIQEMLYNTIKDYYAKINLDIKNPIYVDISNYLVIQKIKGNINGKGNLVYKNGKPYIDAKLDVNRGSYQFNSNDFAIENLTVKFDGSDNKIDPHIDLKSSTKINKEKVNVLINSNLSELFIDLKSSSNKTREELINQLTLNSENLDLSKDLVNFATNTAINQLLNTVTAPIGKKLGLTRFEINTSTVNSEFLSNDILKNTIANIYLQAKLYDDFYWNFKTKIPFDIKNETTNYDVGISYDIKDNFNTIFGIRIDTDYKKKTSTDFYAGFSYNKELKNLSDLFKNKRK